MQDVQRYMIMGKVRSEVKYSFYGVIGKLYDSDIVVVKDESVALEVGLDIGLDNGNVEGGEGVEEKPAWEVVPLPLPPQHTVLLSSLCPLQAVQRDPSSS
jgi:hypothetical protein